MKKLLTGNEAIARGAYEYGISYASAYPGTPSTEILENIANYSEDIIAEWAPNEKVALEAVIGASYAGARVIASMKHVGLNVAADPLMTFSFTGVNGGAVIISADEPGMHSSQNEQDNRYYAKFGKLPMLEPSDSAECKDMIGYALDISEEYDTPVMIRMTTRVCHSKSIVNFGERKSVKIKEYVKNERKNISIPSYARLMHVKVDNALKELEKISNDSSLNYCEYYNKKIGIISAGAAYEYAKEVFEENASYLKIGFTNPLPIEKIRKFADEVDQLYVIEELEPFMEEQIKADGIKCIGKEIVPRLGELSPTILRKVFFEKIDNSNTFNDIEIPMRPPTLCSGCPHRGFFYALKKRSDIMVTGDIGCYGLGAIAPLNAVDTILCMGASVSMGHGAQKVFTKFGISKRTVAVLGDSTFFHTGINSLIDVVYNKSKVVTCILDNRITGMTGHQENPGTGYTLDGSSTNIISIEDVCKAIGVKHIEVVNPLDLTATEEAVNRALDYNEAAVIITRWPCALKKYSTEDIKEFGLIKDSCQVDEEKCIGCRKCIGTGCPSLEFNSEIKKVKIDPNTCVGCEVCMQTCPVSAIRKVVK
ncbi:indolepyruvate ferredoxin oxidoreductase subunit alpha [Helicovermis profundi]|uniref:Indolepyruvate oxidoreductase subunit IorA n=1 Tax=Helicovermis profundi TaxID=3065157 RepID=A0AAU9EJ16_9FIRM|nr:indolepyruvate ferredoxin oxidoreductase subunit alpha [Clostridia bacterium S502]